MGVSTLSKRLLKRLRMSAPQTHQQRRGVALALRGLERRIVLDATVAVGGGSVDLSAFSANTTVEVTQQTFDINGDSAVDDVYRFSLDTGSWNDGVSPLAGGIDLDGIAGVDAFVAGGDLYVSKTFLETNLGGLSIGGSGSNPTIALATNVTTVGNQDYGGPVVLQQGITLDAGAGNLTFSGTVSGPHALEIHSTGVTQFNSSLNLASLTTDAGGQTKLGGDVTTSGSQVYGDAVFLNVDLTLTGSVVEFHDDLEASNTSLQITGDAVLGNDGGDIVNGINLLTVTGQSTIGASSITTLGDQTYEGQVELGTDLTITSPSTKFQETSSATAIR